MDSSLVEDRLFTSLHTLEETGESIRRQLVGSELDLNHFLRQTVEDHVSKIIEELYSDPTLRQTFGLRGSIRFENHSNTLSPEWELEEGMQNIDIRGRPRRRSPRLVAREQRSSSIAATRGPRTPPPARNNRPRADQFCVYNIPSQSSETVNADCEVLGIHGSRGALLKVTLSSHGYTVPAKCTVPEFAEHFRHEAAVYARLRPIQGIYIPLYLGSIDLAHPYSYDGIAYLKHIVLLSPGGQPLHLALRAMSQDSLIAKMKESLSQMHRLNVVHKDPAPRNWCYNPESKKVVFFDFERAEILSLRSILGMISPNRKRKWISCDGLDKSLCETGFAREINKAVQELRGWRK